MNKIENYLGIANHDIQVADNSDELKSYVASILCEIDKLQQENKQLKEVIDKVIKYVEDYTSGERIITYEQYKSELLDILKEVE